MAKRILLFAAVNLLIIVTLTIVLGLLGVGNYLTRAGIDYSSLFIFCLVWGFGGAFLSLAMSRVMAKLMLGVKVIDPDTANAQERALLEMVHRLARSAHLPAMPEVGWYDSDEVNAFATGPSSRRALVAVSAGLLRRMSPEHLEAVLGHEVTHIANGDMVTMTLLQGVVNVFVMFFARVIAYFAAQFAREDTRPLVNFLVTIVLEIAFSSLGLIVVAWFSRQREFRADRGGAQLAGREHMIGALRALQSTLELVDNRQHSLATLKISGKPGAAVSLFATHPPLEQRIAALQQG
ncbi:MAG TPA: protease HtpX [bacterium]|nr:protease HtpX [bacterium]